MKLLYIANTRLPTEKAHGIQIAKTCEALSKLVDLTLMYPIRKNKIKDNLHEYYGIENFKTLEIPAPDFYWPGFLDKLAFPIKAFASACIIIWNTPLADVYYTRDALVAFLLGNKNVVFECHKFSSKKKFFYRRLKYLKTVAISDVLKKDLEDYGFTDVVVARDGVDLKMFDIKLSQEEVKKHCILVSPLGNESLAKVRRKIILHTSQTWKGSLLELNIYWFWIRGVPYKEIPLWLKASDILVLPNNNKDPYTSPMKMFEYMASGRPIVATNIPAIREVLNENNAVLVDPDNLQAGIDRLLADSELGERLAKQARIDIEEYTWDKRADKILNHLEIK